MKTLELNQMEKLHGGKFRVSCAANAIGIGVGLASGNVVLLGFAMYRFISSDCMSDNIINLEPGEDNYSTELAS